MNLNTFYYVSLYVIHMIKHGLSVCLSLSLSLSRALLYLHTVSQSPRTSRLIQTFNIFKLAIRTKSIPTHICKCTCACSLGFSRFGNIPI